MSRARRKSSACSTLWQAAAGRPAWTAQAADVAGGTARRLVDRHSQDFLRETFEGPQEGAAYPWSSASRRSTIERARGRLLEVRHRLAERLAAILVVSAVEPKLGAPDWRQLDEMAFAEPLQAGPANPTVSQAAFDRIRIDLGHDPTQRGDRGGRVLVLVATDEAWKRQIQQAVAILEDVTAMLLARGKILTRNRASARRPSARLALETRRAPLRPLRRDDRRPPALEDPGLLAGDQLDRAAEELDMVDRDRRDDGGERRVDDIGRIEPAAETDLEQQVIGRPRSRTGRAPRRWSSRRR